MKENKSIGSVGLWPFEAWTQGVLVALWRSGTRGLAVDPLCPVGCNVEPTGPWIWLVPARPRDAQSDWDLGNSEARSAPWSLCHVPQFIPELFFHCGGAHCPAGGGTAIWESPWGGVLQVRHLHDRLDPRLPKTTLLCNGMIHVIHITFQWTNRWTSLSPV